MNQPHHPDAELDALAVEFGTVLHSFSAQDPVQHHLSERMTTVVDLAARLGSKIHDAHYALATCSPADRSSHAATATELCHAVGAADRYGNPDADTAFARTRIAAALTTARANLTEASGYLRHLTHTEPRRMDNSCAPPTPAAARRAPPP